MLAASQRTESPAASQRHTLASAKKAAGRLGAHLRLAVENTVPLYSDQVAEITLQPTASRRRRFQSLAVNSHDKKPAPSQTSTRKRYLEKRSAASFRPGVRWKWVV